MLVFEWILFSLSLLVPLVLIGLEQTAHQKLPKCLWRLALLIATVMFILAIIGLFPHYIHTFQLPRVFIKVVQAIAAIVMIYAFIRTFYPFVDQNNSSD